ncbi:MAG: DUF58 domain-containing protein [Spirochaetota bacterium]
MSKSKQGAEQLLDRIEWTVLRRLDGLFQGDYHSLFRGTGLDLADLREYQPSDDVRYIDWNVTARMQTPYVREYHEDRELTAWFLVDMSPSVEVSWSSARKRTVVVEFVALVSRLLTRRGNRVGAIVFDGTATRHIPSGGSREHVLRLVTMLQRRPAAQTAPPTDLARVMRDAARAIRRRSLVFVVSDFVSEPGWEAKLGELARRHETLAVRVVDPGERDLLDLGIVAMEDAESGEQIVVDTHAARFRHAFDEAVAEQEERIRGGLAEAGVDALEILTTDDLIDSILRFAELRKARRTAGLSG